MKIALLKEPESIHLRKWIRVLQKFDVEIMLFSIIRDNKSIDYHEKFPELSGVKIIEIHELFNKNKAQRLIRFVLNKTRYKKIFTKRIAAKIEIELIRNNIDVLHAYGVQYYGQILGYITKVPSIVSIWGSDIFHRKRDLITVQEYNQCFTQASIVESESSYPAEVAWNDFRFDRNKIKVFQWGVDLQIFDLKKYEENIDAIKRKMRIDPKNFVIFSQRSMGDIYNWEEILKSTLLIKNKIKFHLIMIKGFGKNQNILKATKFIKDNDMGEFITIIDRLLPIEELVPLYTISDAFISIPTTDNIADSLIEGLAMKCYPIVSNLETYSDLFTSKNATFIEAYQPEVIAEGIIEASQRIDIDEVIEKNYLMVLKNNSWDEVAKKQIEIYHEVKIT